MNEVQAWLDTDEGQNWLNGTFRPILWDTWFTIKLDSDSADSIWHYNPDKTRGCFPPGHGAGRYPLFWTEPPVTDEVRSRPCP